jgi:arylsulfatase A-like enzyme
MKFLAPAMVALVSSTALATAAEPPPSASRDAARRPNVLFIIADDLNTRIGPYGGPALTPNIDGLARSAVTFDRAYSQFPHCGPSRASFLTGTRPNTNGVMNLTTNFRARLPDIVTLPAYFRQNGYYTARVGKIFHQGVPGGVGRDGLDDPQAWEERHNPSGCDMKKLDQLVNLTPGMPLGAAMTYRIDDCTDADQTDGLVADQTISLLRKAAEGGKPFFIAAGFYRPHVPEIVPAAYFERYRSDGIAVPAATAKSGNILPAARSTTPDDYGMSPDARRAFIRAYYAAISFMDAQVGRILQAVDQMGLADDTIVLFTSDHGYLLGEHHQWQKLSLFEESARMPLIIRVPGNRNAGKHSPRTVEMLDIYPTLTDLAGLPRYARNEGVSLSPLLDKPDSDQWTKPALTQVQGGRSVRTERYRYTEWEGGKSGRELYDHDRDPHERVNLAANPRYAEVAALLRAMLPAGPVEPLASKSRYDPMAKCLVPSSVYVGMKPSEGGGRAGARDDGGAGDGVMGLKVCDLAE